MSYICIRNQNNNKMKIYSNSEERKLKLSSLEGEYRGLSRATDFFPRTSTHKACVHINKRMVEILHEIKLIKES